MNYMIPVAELADGANEVICKFITWSLKYGLRGEAPTLGMYGEKLFARILEKSNCRDSVGNTLLLWRAQGGSQSICPNAQVFEVLENYTHVRNVLSDTSFQKMFSQAVHFWKPWADRSMVENSGQS